MFGLALGIKPLHLVDFTRSQLRQVTDERDQLPAVRVVAGFTPGRHSGPAHAVVDDVIKLAVAELLRSWKPHVRRGRIQIPSDLSISPSVIAVAGRAMIGEVPGGLLQDPRRTGERVLAAACTRR